jgi:hypothetical protein
MDKFDVLKDHKGDFGEIQNRCSNSGTKLQRKRTNLITITKVI